MDTKFGEFLLRGGVVVYAIIETGGKQYKVTEGDVVKVEKLVVEDNASYTFDKVVAFSQDDNFTVGAPYVNGASVTAKVLGQGKQKKVVVYKYKSKKGFHKKKGHRQPFTALKIEKISMV